MEKPDKEEQFKRKEKYKKKFNKIYKELIKTNKDRANELIDKAASMSVMLEDYEIDIYTNGTVSVMPQGEYEIERESLSVKGYNNTIKSYNSIIDRLDKMMPDSKEINTKTAGEALATFITQGKPKKTGGVK